MSHAAPRTSPALPGLASAAVLLVFFAGGCSSKAVDGGFQGMQCGSPLYIICVPVGAAVGAVVGATFGAVEGDRRDAELQWRLDMQLLPPQRSNPDARHARLLRAIFIQQRDEVLVKEVSDADTTLRVSDLVTTCTGSWFRSRISTLEQLRDCKTSSGTYEITVSRGGKEIPAIIKPPAPIGDTQL